MADIVGSFGRGFGIGDNIGNRVAQRRFEKRASEIEQRYLNGDLEDGALDEELRLAAQETGLLRRAVPGAAGGAYHADHASALRDRRALALDRAAAAAATRGDYGSAYGEAGNAAAVRGDLRGATGYNIAREGALAYREGPDGRPALGEQGQAASRAAARAGELGTASDLQQFGDQSTRGYFNFAAGKILQTLPSAIGEDGVVNDERMQELEVYAQELARVVNPNVSRVQYQPEDDSFYVFNKEGQAVEAIPATKLGEYAKQYGDDPESLLPAILNAERGEAQATREAMRERQKEATDFLKQGLLEIIKDPEQANALGRAGAAAGAAGVDISTVQELETGGFLMKIGDEMFMVEPNAERSVDGNPMAFRVMRQDGTDVDAATVSAAQRKAATNFAAALAQTNAALSAEDRMARLEILSQGYQMLSGAPSSALPRRRGADTGTAAGDAAAPRRAAAGQTFDNPDEAAAAALPYILGLETSAGMADDVRNPRSSAMGRGQFLDRTWLQTVKRYAGDEVAGMSDADILQLRADPEFSREMTQAYAAENGRALANAGVPLNPETLYLAHHFGPAGAARLLRAPDDAPLAQVLPAAVLAANPSYRGMTVGALRDSFLQRMDRVAPGAMAQTSGGPSSRPRNARGGPENLASALPPTGARGVGASHRAAIGRVAGRAMEGFSRGDPRVARLGPAADAAYDYITGLLGGE